MAATPALVLAVHRRGVAPALTALGDNGIRVAAAGVLARGKPPADTAPRQS